MNWDLVTKYAVPIVGPLAALTAIPIFFWTNFREHARRLAIIDLATKRIAFWNQFLMTANLATAENSPERKAEQDKAYQAILRIHSEALLQTDALVRKKKIGRSVGWRAFKPEIKRLKKWYYVLFWWWLAIMSALMLLVALLLFFWLEYRAFEGRVHKELSQFLLALGFFFVFSVLSRFFIFQAESLKHDDPLPPIIDVI